MADQQSEALAEFPASPDDWPQIHKAGVGTTRVSPKALRFWVDKCGWVEGPEPTAPPAGEQPVAADQPVVPVEQRAGRRPAPTSQEG